MPASTLSAKLSISSNLPEKYFPNQSGGHMAAAFWLGWLDPNPWVGDVSYPQDEPGLTDNK
jgi:hypothetical protein